MLQLFRNHLAFLRLFILPMAFLWRATGNIYVLGFVWLMLLSTVCEYWSKVREGKYNASTVFLVTTGFLFNGTAIWSNKGHMIALANEAILRLNPGYIQLNTDTPFWFLGDYIGPCSIGDLFIAGAGLCAVLMYLNKRVNQWYSTTR